MDHDDSIQIVPLESRHVQAVRHLNTAILPVAAYTDRFYRMVSDAGHSFVALSKDDRVIGNICLIEDREKRIERLSSTKRRAAVASFRQMYIASLVVLPAYRGRGIGMWIMAMQTENGCDGE